MLLPLAKQATPTLRWNAPASASGASLPPFVGIPALAAGLLFVSLGVMTVTRRVPVVGRLLGA